MFALQLGDVLQRHVLTDLQYGALGARMLKQLGGSRFTADLQLKGLTQVVCKPRTLREFLLVIRNIHHVLLGHATVHSLDLREMGASRLGKNQAGQCTHLSSRVRTLELVLDLLSSVLRLRQPQRALLAPHPQIGIQNARGFAMNGHTSL